MTNYDYIRQMSPDEMNALINRLLNDPVFLYNEVGDYYNFADNGSNYNEIKLWLNSTTLSDKH